MNNILKGEKIRLRAPEPSDLDLIYEWENNTGIWQSGETLTPFSKDTLSRYIENAGEDIFRTGQVRFMICTYQEETVGTIDLFDYNPIHSRAGVGILIGNPSDRGKGYASEALGLLLDYCRNVLLMHQVWCSVRSDNPASIALFKKAGFRQTGVKSQWVLMPEGWKDEVFMQFFV